MQAILLAAGFGTRLQPYTLLRPKPLFPVLNQMLLEVLLAQLAPLQCAQVVVNAHHLADQVARVVEPYPGVVLQPEPSILGTGGSLRLARRQLDDEPVLVMNGDLYHRIDLLALYRHHQQSNNGVTMAMHDCSRFNSVRVQDDRVLEFSCTGADCLAFTGIHVVEPWVIERIPQEGFFHVIDLYQELAKEHRIGAFRVDGSFWRDIGTPQDYLQLHEELLTDPAPSWCVHSEAMVGSGVVLAQWGAIGKGARIGAGSSLQRCVVWPDAEIAAGSRFVDRIITGNPEIDGTGACKGLSAQEE